MSMQIGEKVKQLRTQLGLTQEELADRTELSKGFISQLERDLTSPSIATLVDILDTLGTDLAEFFKEAPNERIVFTPQDRFVKEDEGYTVEWLVPNAQKNQLEPILVTLEPGGSTYQDDPHMGEEFGYVLAGTVTLMIGGKRFKLKKGDSFCFEPAKLHYILNHSKREALLLWVSTPPSF